MAYRKNCVCNFLKHKLIKVCLKCIYVFYGKALIAVRRRVANAGVFTFVSATSVRAFQVDVTGDGMTMC